MTWSRWQRVAGTLAVFCAAGLAACGGGDGTNAGGTSLEIDAGGTPDADVGVEPDTAPECQLDEDCGSGLVCRDQECVPEEDACVYRECERNDECSGSTPFCNARDNVCVECQSDSHCSRDAAVCNDDNTCEIPDAQCESVGDSCDPSGAPGGIGFLCADLGQGGTCIRPCDPRVSSPCESGSACLPLTSSDQLPYGCYPSQCDGPNDLDGCEEVSDHVYFSGSDFKCGSVSNGADVCVPDGEKQGGESCTATSPVENVFCSGGDCSACTAGNVCRGGTCRSICRSGSSDEAFTCGGDDECIGTDNDGIIGADAGFCGEACEAYSRGQCSGSETGCMALDNETGYCRPIGDKGFMEDCEAADECQEGMQCITFQQGGSGVDRIAKCMPICDPAAPDEPDQRANDATCGGMMYGRFVHLADAPSEVDVYVDEGVQVDNLATGVISDADTEAEGPQFFGFRPRQLDLQVTDAAGGDTSNPLAEASPFAESGQVHTWAIVQTGSGLDLQAIDVPHDVEQPGEGEVTVRAIQQVPDFGTEVEVLLVPDGGTLADDGMQLADEASRGDVGKFVEIPGDATYALHILEQGADREAGEALEVIEGLELEAGSRTSLYLKGTVAGGDGAELDVVEVAYAEAPKQPDYTCWGQGQVDPAPASGLCLQGCEAADYGQGNCFADGNGCTRFQDGSQLCTPRGDNEPGEECNQNRFRSCVGGATCEEYGDGTSRCHAYCTGGDSDNPELNCDEGETCTAQSSGSFGTCEQSCSPDDRFIDEDCPEGRKTCIPQSRRDGEPQRATCSPSNDRELGDECGGSSDRDVLLQNCQPGLICAYENATDAEPLVGPFLRRANEEPTCKEPCDPFADDPGCPEGTACGVDLAFQASSEAGLCLEKAQCLDNQQTGTRCTEANLGTMCGEHSHCVRSGERVTCIEFCDAETGEGCTGDTSCEPYAGGVGRCVEPQ